jgi:xanthine dehydrogenase molybdenum-binding subunit
MSEYSIIGKSIPKVDSREKVTGRAMYSDDIQMPGMLYGKIVRCMEYAHARVKKLDFTEALKVPGVIKILGPDDVTTNTYNSGVMDSCLSDDLKVLAGEIAEQVIFATHVKHQGEAICGVIAKTEDATEKAAALIKVDYEVLPVYMNVEDSNHPDAVQFSDLKPDNLAFQGPGLLFPSLFVGHGDVDKEMAGADIVFEEEFYTPKAKQAQMEPHGYIALYDDRKRLNIWTATQMPKLIHERIASIFEMPMTRVKINQTTVGGAFGARLGMIGEPHACAMALAVPNRPIKVNFSREEDWIASESRHPALGTIKMGFKKDGTPVACDFKCDTLKGGHYTHGIVTLAIGLFAYGVYHWNAFRFDGKSYFTNQVACGAYRGYGNPQANFMIEQMIERACTELNVDPIEWRKKWHKKAGDDIWNVGTTYTTNLVDECMDRGAEAIGWAEKRKKYANQTGTKRRGIGVSVMAHCSGGFPLLLEHTVTTVRLNEDATAEVITACSDLGQGSHTVLRQIAAESLGFPLEDVHMKTGDTDAAGFDIGAHASRTTYVGGNSLLTACEDAKRQIFERAGKLLEANPEDLELKDKKITVKGSSDKSYDLVKLLHNGVYGFMNPVTGEYDIPTGQIQGYASYYPTSSSPPWAACFVEVEVDTETGEVSVEDLVYAYDIGRAINPAAVEGQLEGGVQQGLGLAMTEETYYDDNGLCLNNSWTDYKMFGPTDMPNVRTILVETEDDPLGPFGAKACGESGGVAPIGATANAIYHALGIQLTNAPITPEKILKAIKEKGIK